VSTPPPSPARPHTERLWRFAVTLYDRPGVAPACLELQDLHQFDVPILLWAAWLGRCDLALGPDILQLAQMQTQAWRQDVLTPLRQARQGLTQAKPPAVLRANAARLRAEIKGFEIDAEQLLLHWLAEILPAPLPVPPLGREALIKDNLLAVAGPRGAEAPITAHLHRLATAAARLPASA
jgi:uncharacterized protein (TIGR02444 family)